MVDANCSLILDECVYTGGVNVTVQDSMGSIDFFTSNTTAVVLLSEAEVMDRQQYQNKLMRLAQVQNM